MTLAKVAAQGARQTLGGQLAKFLIQTASLMVLARLLDPTDFGLYAMAMAIVGVALLLGDFGLSLASIQAPDVSDGQRTNLFWLNLLIGAICFSVMFLLADVVADFYGEDELTPIIRVISTIFFIHAASAQFSANASRALRFKVLASADVSSQFAGLLVAVFAAMEGWGYWSLVAQQLSAAASFLVVLAIRSTWYPGLPRKGARIGYFVRFGSNTVLSQIVAYFSTNADSIVLGRVAGADELGVYDRAYQIFKMPIQQIAAPMSRVALPILSRIDDPVQFQRYLVRAQLVLAYTLCGAFAIGVAAADPMLTLLLGGSWAGADTIFSVLAIGGIFQSIGYVYYWVFLAKGMTGLQLRIALVVRPVMVVLIVVGAKWGVLGVAVAVSAGLVFNWLVLTFFAMPRAGVGVVSLLRALVGPAIVFVPMVVVCRLFWWQVKPMFSAVSGIVAVGGVAILVAVLIGCSVPMIRRDVVILRNTARASVR